MTLTPPIATLIFVAASLAGYNFRRAWQKDAPRWQLWMYGVTAAVGLIILGVIPMANG